MSMAPLCNHAIYNVLVTFNTTIFLACSGGALFICSCSYAPKNKRVAFNRRRAACRHEKRRITRSSPDGMRWVRRARQRAPGLRSLPEGVLCTVLYCAYTTGSWSPRSQKIRYCATSTSRMNTVAFHDLWWVFHK